MFVKTIWSFFPRRKSFFNITIFFVRLIRKVPTFFLCGTVETQENSILEKVREENILKFANKQRVKIFRVKRFEASGYLERKFH